jgi:hypothetical protein
LTWHINNKEFKELLLLFTEPKLSKYWTHGKFLTTSDYFGTSAIMGGVDVNTLNFY